MNYIRNIKDGSRCNKCKKDGGCGCDDGRKQIHHRRSQKNLCNNCRKKNCKCGKSCNKCNGTGDCGCTYGIKRKRSRSKRRRSSKRRSRSRRH